MAKKALSAPEIPLCINVLRLLNYRLAPRRADSVRLAYSKTDFFLNTSLSITPRRV